MSYANWRPERTKFRRLSKGVLKTVSHTLTNNTLKFGWYGLQSLGQNEQERQRARAARAVLLL